MAKKNSSRKGSSSKGKKNSKAKGKSSDSSKKNKKERSKQTENSENSDYNIINESYTTKNAYKEGADSEGQSEYATHDTDSSKGEAPLYSIKKNYKRTGNPPKVLDKYAQREGIETVVEGSEEEQSSEGGDERQSERKRIVKEKHEDLENRVEEYIGNDPEERQSPLYNIPKIVQNVFDLTAGNIIVSKWNKENYKRLKKLGKGDKVIVFAHGMYENKGAFREAMNEAERRGYIPLSFGYDYNNEKQGAKQLAHFVNDVHRISGANIHVYGHSTGANIADRASKEHPVLYNGSVKGDVLAAPTKNGMPKYDTLDLMMIGGIPKQDNSNKHEGRHNVLFYNKQSTPRRVVYNGTADKLVRPKRGISLVPGEKNVLVKDMTHFAGAGGTPEYMGLAISSLEKKLEIGPTIGMSHGPFGAYKRAA